MFVRRCAILAVCGLSASGGALACGSTFHADDPPLDDAGTDAASPRDAGAGDSSRPSDAASLGPPFCADASFTFCADFDDTVTPWNFSGVFVDETDGGPPTARIDVAPDPDAPSSPNVMHAAVTATGATAVLTKLFPIGDGKKISLSLSTRVDVLSSAPNFIATVALSGYRVVGLAADSTGLRLLTIENDGGEAGVLVDPHPLSRAAPQANYGRIRLDVDLSRRHDRLRRRHEGPRFSHEPESRR